VNLSIRFYLEIVRRYLVVLAVSFWLGGFTFYSVVVIHTAHRVLDSMLETGLITQRVSGWLNLIGVGALVILLWDVFALWRIKAKWMRWVLVSLWVVMAGVQVWLFLLHPNLDRQIDLETRDLVNRMQFRSVHTFYVTLSTVQWAAGLVYVFCALCAWRCVDTRVSVQMRHD
jgi:hypothetical protein